MSDNIKVKIDVLNNQIIKLHNSSKDRFVLNKEIAEKLDEIEELQKQCSHDFANGFCAYCGRAE